MKASKVLKQLEKAMFAESKRLGDFWKEGGGTQGSAIVQEAFPAHVAWNDAAILVRKKRKALEELEK